RQAPNGDGATLQATAILIVRLDLLEEPSLLSLVHVLHGLNEVRLISSGRGYVTERLQVLREARSTVPDTGVDEVVADARVRSDPRPNILDIRPDALRDVGEFIHKGNLRRQDGVGSVLREFRG